MNFIITHHKASLSRKSVMSSRSLVSESGLDNRFSRDNYALVMRIRYTECCKPLRGHRISIFLQMLQNKTLIWVIENINNLSTVCFKANALIAIANTNLQIIYISQTLNSDQKSF